MKIVTGQYECAHPSGLGLDYFTAKLDRLTLYANGRFTLITQDKSRLLHAAKSLASGQQASVDAPETHAEGTYSPQNSSLLFVFDSGEQKQVEILEEGLQIGKDYFEKVTDSTYLPPPQRVKSNMEDIVKGLKIAGAIGGTMMKAARTIQDTLQTQPAQQQSGTSGTAQNGTPPPAQPSSQASQSWSAPRTPPPQAAPAQDTSALYCDQCGLPVRPGKKFCNHCGASLS